MDEYEGRQKRRRVCLSITAVGEEEGGKPIPHSVSTPSNP